MRLSLVSKGTEISLGKFVSEYFTPLTLETDSPMVEETEVEKSFWISRPDGWVINRKMKKIILLEFKRTSDCGESYFKNMWRVTEKQQTPIMIGLRVLAKEREWKVAVVPLVAGQRSVREKECLETFRIFGIGHTFGPSIILLQLLGKVTSVRTSRPPQGG
jgi:hypothetical protein